MTVISALQLHEPSLRIFRSLLEINLVLFGVAFSLFMWSKIASQDTIEEIFFRPLDWSLSSTINSYSALFKEARIPSTASVLEEDDDVQERHGEPGIEKIGVPSASQILGSALDNLLLILVALLFYTITTLEYFDHGAMDKIYASIAAPVFPLLLFIYMCFRSVFPWSQRGSFWIVLSLTISAPWAPVTFRDGFIGDVLTSSVRPLQDIVFTLSYLLSGLQGYWSDEYHHDFVNAADRTAPRMERSWLLHTVILPMCMISPLWWRFLQTLRQTFDYKRRWPFLGNSLKYFCAAQVAMIGVFFPESKQSIWWLVSFVLATLYQVWWDVYMDWNLLTSEGHLRAKRLFQSTWIYWTIALINFVLRFCWTLSFLPLRYLNPEGILRNSFSGGPIIASAEIVRRTLWGLLRFEWEVIQHGDSGDPLLDGDDSSIEMAPMQIEVVSSQKAASDMSSSDAVQILGELAIYAAAFGLIGFVAAAHRAIA